MKQAQKLSRVAANDTDLRARFIERMESDELELPIMPEAATSVLAACRDDEAGPRQIAAILERDPSLAGHVLRLANSAAYGAAQPIVSLPQAVSRMGLATVAEIAVAAALRGRVFHAGGHPSLIEGLWANSAAAAGWAREIARMRRRNVEGAFLCGLLHDIGRPVILQSIVDLERDERCEFEADRVSRVMDEFHAAVGATLVLRWELPEWMADAIRSHHHPLDATAHRDEAMTTALADALAHWSIEREADDRDELRSLPLLAGLELYPDDLDRLLEARDRVRATVESLS